MSKLKRRIADRALAMLLSLLMLFAMVPVTAFAASVSTLTTNIDQKEFNVGIPTEFTFTTTANDDLGKMVKGSFVFSDTEAIEKLEYKEVQDGNWYEFYGDFGPDTGFPMSDATSTFRVTFKEAGEYTLTASMKTVDGGDVLCDNEQTIVVNKKSSTLTTDIGEKEFYVGQTTEFTFTTIPNDDAGIMVLGSFVFSAPEAIEKLEYEEVKDGNWYEFYGDFGPAATGFPMSQATSTFRVTFKTAGNYSLTASMKKFGTDEVLCSCVNNIIVGQKFTVTTSFNEGGSVTLEDEVITSAEVDAGTNMQLKVTADEGYQISSVVIGGVEETLGANPVVFNKEVTISSDTAISVVFVKVYTIGLTVDGNGNVETNPANVGGSLTVHTGTDVTVTATPNLNYRVSKVLINDVEDNTVKGENDEDYEYSFKADKDYKFAITFVPNKFNIKINTPSNGTVTSDVYEVNYDQTAIVTIIPDSGYIIDSIKVIGSATGEKEYSYTQVDDYNANVKLENVVEDKTITVTFKLSSSASMDDVKFNYDDAVRTSNDEKLYVFKSGTTVRFEAINGNGGIKINKDEKNWPSSYKIGTWDITSTTTITNIQVYKDGWHTLSDVSEQKPIKIVFDETKPNVTITPSSNAYEYYNDDVSVKISAVDGGDFSGLKSVEYSVSSNGVETMPLTSLYSYQDGDAIQDKFEDTIIVDADTNNTGNVVITVKSIDMADNETTETKTIKINNVKPIISLDIDGTKNQGITTAYYNSNRVLTITIVDREDTFSAKEVSSGLNIKLNGQTVTVNDQDISWASNTLKGTHIGTYTFATDGEYDWNFSYVNKAGSTNEVDVPETKDIYNFTIDKVNPSDLEISYNPIFLETVLETVRFGFYKMPVKVTIKAKDTTSGIEKLVYSYKVSDGVSATNEGKTDIEVFVDNNPDLTIDNETVCYTFEIPAQFRGNVSFKAYDKAGNISEVKKDGRVAVVDTVAPGVTVTYDEVPVASNDTYYNENRKATITIEEANFFQDDVKDGLLVVTVTETDDNGSQKTETWKPTFTKSEGDKYTAELTFDENLDYTFTIKYTDRAGNVYDSYEKDVFTVDKVKPLIKVSFDNNTCTNDNQFKEQRKATIKITEHNFDASTVVADVKLNGVSTDEYTAQLTNPSNWTKKGNEYTAVITFNADANYTFDVSCTDLAGNKSADADFGSSVAPNKFTVDKSAPTGLKIVYEPDFIGIVLEVLTFGFYKAPVKVKLIANDPTASVDFFTYSYTVQSNVSNVNQGKSNVVITSVDIKTEADGTQYATFDIPAEFRGFVSFKATDKAGNFSTFADENAVVVDSIAPGVTVSYNNNNAKNSKYYDADRKVTIQITEANYFADDIEDGLLVITVGKTPLSGVYSETNIRPTFTKNGDIYTATYDFNENADYTFDIKYTDRAGNVYDSYEKDEFTIDKINPEIAISYDNMSAQNKTFYKADRKATITVVEHNFCADDVAFTISATDVTGKKNIDLSSKGYETYLKNQENWTQNGDIWTAQIDIDIEGNYTLGMTYKDLAEREQVKAISDSFCIDKSLPSNLKVSYSKSVLDCIIETLLYGFYEAPVTVTIEATDEYAGVDYFEYSYEVEGGASSTNAGKSKVRISSANIDYSRDKATAKFKIPAQYRGCVSFVVTDKAGNNNSIADEKVIVVDNVAPGVKVEYDNNAPKYDKYYDADRRAKITITEANFFGTEEWGAVDLNEEYLVITVGKTLNDGSHTETNVHPTFKKNGDVYTATILFSEDADYTFDIKYTDRSGNVYDNYTMDEFTIDKINPVIELSYNNNTCKNGDKFNANRTATIKVTEHNFIASDVVAEVKASGKVVDSYVEYLKDRKNWTKSGDVYTASITYSEEAHYEFKISCTDMAGNLNDTVDFGESVSPLKFTLDKSAPTDLDILISDVSVKGSMETLVFNKFYDSTVTVKLSANCDISGNESFKYQKVASISEYNEEGTWLDYNVNTGIVVEPNEKFVIYFRAEDRAGNVSIVTSTGIVVDDKMPIGEIFAPEIDIIPAAANAHNLHNGDVKVDFEVKDPKYIGSSPDTNGHYSGINKITYKIYTTDTDAIEEGVLMDLDGSTEGAVFDEDALVRTWSGSRIIDSTKFNSNNVIVEVSATDNAGNTRVSTTKAGDIQIDITKPRIDISYDNNEADSERYFKADRTATIVVTERNFNSEEVKLTITNTDGVIPKLSGWTKTAGIGNLDNITWTATVTYDADGDYTFGIEYTDLADNKCDAANYGTSVRPTEFTIDKTLPVISVNYDNNNALSANYYKEVRIATIVITEHNFNTDRIKTMITATDDGTTITVPNASTWTTNGDVHTATIAYTADALYNFDIEYSDLAGNAAADFEQQTFYVDKTAPSLEITGVKNESANNGDVIPVITYSDTNFDVNNVTITLVGAERKAVALDGTKTEIYNGQVFTFKNFAKDRSVDDIYTLTVKLTDKAGNSSEQIITFSVNRFGSTYALSSGVGSLNGTYVKDPIDVTIIETNANELKNIKITMFKNNETIELELGKDFDYTVDVAGGNGQWYHYTYTIFAKNFKDDGVYRMTIHSEDAAGNVAENTLDTKNTAIQFGVDNTKPTITVTNLDRGVTYALDNMTVTMSLNDNLLLNEVKVYLDDYSKVYKTWNADEIAEILESNSEFTFDISGDSAKAHKVKIVCIDAAGNESEEEITNFYVNTNLWVRYYTNKALFFGSIGGVIVLAGLTISLVLVNRKKKNIK